MRIRNLAKELVTDEAAVLNLLRELGHARYTHADQQLPAEVEAQVRRKTRSLPRVGVLALPAPRVVPSADPEVAAFEKAMSKVRPLGADAPRSKVGGPTVAGGAAPGRVGAEGPGGRAESLAGGGVVAGVAAAGRAGAEISGAPIDPLAFLGARPLGARAPERAIARAEPPKAAHASVHPQAQDRWADPRVELAEARAFEAEQRLAEAEARLAQAEARVRVVEEHLALADAETAAAHARAIAEEERVEALAALLGGSPGSLRSALEQRGLRGEAEHVAALRALLDGRRYAELARLELAHPALASALFWERVVLLAEEEPVPTGVVAVRVPLERSEGKGAPAVRTALSRLSTACLVSGVRRLGVAGGPPALHRLLRDGLDARIELQQWPGDRAARGLVGPLTGPLVLWGTDVAPDRFPGAIRCPEPDLVSLANRTADALALRRG